MPLLSEIGVLRVEIRLKDVNEVNSGRKDLISKAVNKRSSDPTEWSTHTFNPDVGVK